VVLHFVDISWRQRASRVPIFARRIGPDDADIKKIRPGYMLIEVYPPASTTAYFYVLIMLLSYRMARGPIEIWSPGIADIDFVINGFAPFRQKGAMIKQKVHRIVSSRRYANRSYRQACNAYKAPLVALYQWPVWQTLTTRGLKHSQTVLERL